MEEDDGLAGTALGELFRLIIRRNRIVVEERKRVGKEIRGWPRKREFGIRILV